MGQGDILQPGETVGPYRVLTRIGTGGMGEVYKAEEPALERTVALKVMTASLAADKTYVERFRTEAKAAAALIHPNVVNVFGVGELRGALWIAMEYVDGESIQQKLLRDKTLSAAQTIGWAIQAARGLEAAARKGVVHRDIKPHNLLIDHDGTLKIADFGLAKIVTSDLSLTQSGVTLGTPIYMSPEQGRGDQVDFRSDMYALGATIYHALAGKPPFEAATPLQMISKHAMTPVTPLHTVRFDIPENLSGVISKMMAKNPSERYPTYAQLIAELERILPSLPASAPPPPPPGTSASRAPSPRGAASSADLQFGKIAVKTGMLTDQQLKGALQLQEKLKASGKPRRLDEILLAAKLLTKDQVEVLKREDVAVKVAATQEEDESHGPKNLQVSDLTKRPPVKAHEAKGPVCVLCKLEVRPDHVQTTCDECGAIQHAECFTSFGGCGNELCMKSPRSIVGRKPDKDGPRGAATSGDSTLPAMLIKLGILAAVIIGAVLIWKATARSAQDYFDEARALGGAARGRLSIFSIDEVSKDAAAGTTGLTGETQRRLEQQLALYRKAVEKDPGFTAARAEIASCLLQLNRRDEALPEFEKVLAADPGNKDALCGIGVLLLQKNEDLKAEDYLRKASAAGVVEAWLNIAVIYQDRRRSPALAIEPLQKYLAVKSDDGNAWARLASAHFDVGNDSEAFNASDQATSKGADSPVAALVKAKLAFKVGHFEEAAAAALAATEKMSGTSQNAFDARKIAGRAYAKAGKPGPAREQLGYAKALNNADVEVLSALAELAVAAGDWTDAASNYKEAFDRGGRDFENLFKSGYYHYMSSNAAGAAAVFEELQRRKPEYKDVRVWLARAYLKTNSIESAGPAVAKALAENPDDPERQALKVWDLTNRAQLDQAISYGEECLAKSPGSSSLHFRVSEACKVAKKNEGFVNHLREAADLGDPEAIFAYGDHLLSQGDKATATRYYQAYLEKMPVGINAARARQIIVSLTSGSGSSGSGSSTGWEAVISRALADIAKPFDPAVNEMVDSVYVAQLAAIAIIWTAGDRMAETAGMLSDFTRAEAYFTDGLNRFKLQPNANLADLRVKRVRERFIEIATWGDRLVLAFAAYGRRLNDKAAGDIEKLTSRFAATAPKDPFDRTSTALDFSFQILAAATGGKGAADAAELVEAELLLASNAIQQCVARLHGIIRLLIDASPDREKLLDAFRRADDAADSGLAQIQAGFSQITMLINDRRRK